MRDRVLRSSTMATPNDLKNYFTGLVKPLATQEKINVMFEEFKKDVLCKLEKHMKKQDEKIERLESILAVREKVIENLMIDVDDNQQYSRHSCVRINRIEKSEEEEDTNSVIAKVRKCFEEVKVPFKIDRTHRVGRGYVDDDGKKFQPIIVEFKSWGDRANFYKARPKFNVQNPGSLKFSVAVVLTKRRYELLRFARGVIKDNVKVKYAFADINCSLALRLANDSLCFFNSKDNLSEILNNLDE